MFGCSDRQSHQIKIFDGHSGILFCLIILFVHPPSEDGGDKSSGDDVLHVGALHVSCEQFRMLQVLIPMTIVKQTLIALILEPPKNGVSVQLVRYVMLVVLNQKSKFNQALKLLKNVLCHKACSLNNSIINQMLTRGIQFTKF